MKKSGIQFSAILLVLAMILITAGCDALFNGGFKKTKSGIKYKVYNKSNKDTTRVRVGSVILLDMSYGLKDTLIFDSKKFPNEVRFPVAESQYEGDLFEALLLFHQGDSATVIIKAGPFFTQTVGQPTLPEGFKEDDDLYFNLKFKQVQTQEEIAAEERANMEKLRIAEDELIRSYIAEKNITAQPNPSGIYFIEKKKGSGISPDSTDYVAVHFTVSRLTGEQIFSTREKGEEPIEFQCGSNFENAGFREAIRMMKNGGTATAIVPSNMAFGEMGAGDIIAPYTPLCYDLEVVKVIPAAEWNKKEAAKNAAKKAESARLEKEEGQLLKKYLTESGITTPPRPSGLIYIERQKGTGPQAVAGKTVQVHYTGKLLDGSVFDSSYDRGQPFEFTLGKRSVIEGWEEGIALMNEGGKATLIIPSRLGYKDRGAGGRIAPFSSLVFEVELVKVSE